MRVWDLYTVKVLVFMFHVFVCLLYLWPVFHKPSLNLYSQNDTGYLTTYFTWNWSTVGLSTRDFRSGSDADRGCGSKDHFASTRPRSGYELHDVLLDCAWHPTNSAMRVCRVEFTRDALNPDPGSGSSESSFRAPISIIKKPPTVFVINDLIHDKVSTRGTTD